MRKIVQYTKTDIEGLYRVETETLEDARGAFNRFYCQDSLTECLPDFEVSQINFSYNKAKGTIRGMHMQVSPHAEIKLVRCIRGSVLDVVVDLRRESETFLKHQVFELSANNKSMLIIPKGLAHGFQTLEDNTELLYMHSENYEKKSEFAVNAFDPVLNINWPMPVSQISDKDNNLTMLSSNFQGIEI